MIKFLILTSVSFFYPEIKQDSIGIETINGKTFILHQVALGETLYGIAKRYGSSVDAVLEYNQTADAGLEVEQILKVPYVPRKIAKKITSGSTHIVLERETLFSISRQYGVTVDKLKLWNNLTDTGVNPGQELIIKSESKNAVSVISTETKSVNMMHTVSSKETMFSITRQYGISIEQLREWNGLQSDELKVGQALVVSQPVYSSISIPQSVPDQVIQQQQTISEEIKPLVKAKSLENEPTITISEGVRGTNEVLESGLAELIEGTQGNRKYLALHRTAPVGSILKVKNEMSNREVFVRVMGRLPDTALTDRLIIKISKSAYDRLGAIDLRFRVEVTYYK